MDAHRSRTASTGGTGQQLTCGLRDVRDYEAASGGDPTRLGSSSPFNVKVTSLKLGNFEPAEVEALYTQHTAETGQAFTPEAVARAIELIGCQRWLDPTYDDNLLYRRDLG